MRVDGLGLEKRRVLPKEEKAIHLKPHRWFSALALIPFFPARNMALENRQRPSSTLLCGGVESGAVERERRQPMGTEYRLVRSTPSFGHDGWQRFRWPARWNVRERDGGLKHLCEGTA